MTMSDSEFGVWLADRRRRLRASLNDIARHANISSQTVKNAEDGLHVRPETRDAIEDAVLKMEALRLAASHDWASIERRLAALERQQEEFAALERQVTELAGELAGLGADLAELVRVRSRRARKREDPPPPPTGHRSSDASVGAGPRRAISRHS